MKYLLVALSILFISGCTSMADGMSKMAGLGVVSESKSTFDDSRVVEVSPAHLYVKGSWGNNVMLGAKWSDNKPDHVALIMEQNSSTSSAGSAYVGLQGLDLNIDGEILKFKANTATSMDRSGYNTVSKTIYTSSTNAVVVPYSVFVRMLEATDCRIRIHTTDGYEDSLFSTERIPGGQGTAILSLKQFRQKVESIKG